MLSKKYKMVEFPDCKNEQQVLKKMEDTIKKFGDLSIIHTGSAVKVQTCTDKYGKDTDNPYIKLIGNIEFLNGKYVLKYRYDNKIKFMFFAMAIVLAIFIAIALNNAQNTKHTLFLSVLVVVSGGLFTLNNYFNANYNISTIERYLEQFGEIKKCD